MQKEKIKEALNSAMTYLDDSIQALTKNNDEKAVINLLWFASSETEYALFLFSLMHPEEAESSWKQSSQPKQMIEVAPTLASAQSLLKEAKNHIEADITEKAYEETWTARNLLLKVQELFEKKRKSAMAQSTRIR